MHPRIHWIASALAALATSASAQLFYTVHPASDTLYTIDATTLTLTPIGPLGVNFAYGDIAYDSSTATMYMVDGWGGGTGSISSLYAVDLNTGAATLVGSTGVASVFGLAWDPTTSKLYGSTSTIGLGVFLEIDRTTGAGTIIGNNGIGIDALTYVGSTGDIAGLNAGPGRIYQLDRMTGAATLLTPGGGFVNNCGMAWDASSNAIFAIDVSGALYSFDVVSGYARTTVASGLGGFDGLAATGGGAPPTSYCTPGTSTNGCLALASSSGSPSASAGSGFTITIANVEGQKTGLVFYGINGEQALPWGLGASFLCVKAPAQRTTAQNAGGTLQGCDGTISIDWNAFIAANPSAVGQPFAGGETVWAQGWYRDPPSPKTTSLSDGLRFTVGP